MSLKRRLPAATSQLSVGVTVDEVLDAAAQRIRDSPAIDVWQEWQPRSDAEQMIGEVLGHDVDASVLDDSVTAAQIRRFNRLVDRRVAGEPVALVVGHIGFAGIDLQTRAGVFVPRLSSEVMAGVAARRLGRFGNPVAVDIATGSGPLALTMAHRVPASEVWGLDIAADAVALCRHNAKRLGLANAHFRVSDLFAAMPRRLRGRVAVITIHPPYVAKHELEHLPDEIRAYEPTHTLNDRSDDGLGLVRGVAEGGLEWLRPGGWLILEIGPHLSRRTQTILRRAGFADVAWTTDRVGVTRIVSGRASR